MGAAPWVTATRTLLRQCISRSMKSCTSAINTASRLSKHARKKCLEIAGMSEGKCVFLTVGQRGGRIRCPAGKSDSSGEKLCLSGRPVSVCLWALRPKGGRTPGMWSSGTITIGKVPTNGIGQLENAIDFSQAGTFVFEPGNTSGLVKLPPQELIFRAQSVDPGTRHRDCCG